MLHGDFGTSYTYRVPVSELIVQRIGVSLPLALYALVAGAKPADNEHPYGHAKMELLSAVATGSTPSPRSGQFPGSGIN